MNENYESKLKQSLVFLIGELIESVHDPIGELDRLLKAAIYESKMQYKKNSRENECDFALREITIKSQSKYPLINVPAFSLNL
jgi:hypothetical protein